MRSGAQQQPSRAAIYCRVSSAGQEDNSSLETQEERCRAYAADQGWSVVQMFHEVHSGADLFERSQLAKLRALVVAREVDVVLAYALDRISRSQAHLGFLLSEWDHAGVRLDLVTEDFADSPEGRLLQSVRGFVAEMERLKIRERTQRGLQARVAAGRPLVGCRPPFGYRWADEAKTRLTQDPERAPVVERIFALALAGTSLRAIAKALTAEGVSTATGRSLYWEPTTIYRLLIHPVYAGHTAAYRYRRERQHGKTPKVSVRPEEEQIQLADIVDSPLITPDQHLAIIERLEQNKRRATRSNKAPEETLLRAGFVRCGYCGSPLTVKRYPGRNRNSAYRCVGIAADRYGCPGFAIVAPVLDAAVWSKIAGVLQDPEVVAREVARLGQQSTADRDVAGLDRRLAEIATRQTRLARLAASIDDEDASAPLVAELRFLAEQKRRLAEERDVLEARAEQSMRQAKQLLDLADWCARVSENLTDLTYDQRRQVLEALHVDVRVWRSDHTPRWAITMDLPVEDTTMRLTMTPEAA